MKREEPTSLRDYIFEVAIGDQKWRDRAACKSSNPTIVRMFTCDEQTMFELAGKRVSGFHIQQYLVAEYCRSCPVQWECCRHAIQYEMDERFTGAWSMLRRDLRWLHAQPDPLGFIDKAKLADVPVSIAVQDARAKPV